MLTLLTGLLGKGQWKASREVSFPPFQPLSSCSLLGAVRIWIWGECLCSGTSDRSCSLEFSGWLYSAVRMRESSWAESLAKSSGKVKFIHWECFPQPDSYADNLEFSPSLFKFKWCICNLLKLNLGWIFHENLFFSIPLYPIQNGLKCNCFFKNPVCWKFFNLLFPLPPPENFAQCKAFVLSFTFPCSSPLGGSNAITRCWKMAQ